MKMENKPILVKGNVIVDGENDFNVEYAIKETGVRDWLQIEFEFVYDIQSVTFCDEIGFYTADLSRVLKTLSEFEFIMLNDGTHEKTYCQLLSYFNLYKLSLSDFETICNVLNYTFESEEIRICCDDWEADEFKIDERFVNYIKWHVDEIAKENVIFAEKTEYEVTKAIIHNCVKAWISARYIDRHVSEMDSNDY